MQNSQCPVINVMKNVYVVGGLVRGKNKDINTDYYLLVLQSLFFGTDQKNCCYISTVASSVNCFETQHYKYIFYSICYHQVK